MMAVTFIGVRNRTIRGKPSNTSHWQNFNLIHLELSFLVLRRESKKQWTKIYHLKVVFSTSPLSSSSVVIGNYSIGRCKWLTVWKSEKGLQYNQDYSLLNTVNSNPAIVLRMTSDTSTGLILDHHLVDITNEIDIHWSYDSHLPIKINNSRILMIMRMSNNMRNEYNDRTFFQSA